MFFFRFALCLFAVPIFGQTLNSWRQHVFTDCCGSDEHYVDQLIDGTPRTFYENDGLPAQLALLFNSQDTYLGFYIQSSNSYITDYYIEPVDAYPGTEVVIDRASNANSSFTVTNFYDAEGRPQIGRDTIFVYITGTQDNGPAIVNETYPIYQGDTIVYPAGQSASPSPNQSSASTPTPTSTIYPTPTGRDLKLNFWPTSGSSKPIPIGGDDGAALVDGDPSTGSSQTLVTNLDYPATYDPLFITATTYVGLYVLSESPSVHTHL